MQLIHGAKAWSFTRDKNHSSNHSDVIKNFIFIKWFFKWGFLFSKDFYRKFQNTYFPEYFSVNVSVDWIKMQPSPKGYKIQLLSIRIIPETYIDTQKIVYLKHARVCLQCLTTSSPVYINYKQHSLNISWMQILNINSFSLPIILPKLHVYRPLYIKNFLYISIYIVFSLPYK